jgi:plasmid maintenance system antidote protein VapI
MKNAQAQSILFDYLTTYRATINLVALAQQIGTSRTALSEFLTGKRDLSQQAQDNLISLLKAQAAQVAKLNDLNL